MSGATPAPAPQGAVLRVLSGKALRRALPDLAALRLGVFREWPYLYEGDAAYERRYLQTLADAPDAVIVGAFPGAGTGRIGRGPVVGDAPMIGAATGLPLAVADAPFRAAYERAGLDPATRYYLAESVLDPHWRGRGIGVAFFSHRERAARAAGFARACFCAVARAPDDPRRPARHVPLDGFWTRRGYARVPVEARYAWRDLNEGDESEKTMVFWERAL